MVWSNSRDMSRRCDPRHRQNVHQPHGRNEDDGGANTGSQRALTLTALLVARAAIIPDRLIVRVRGVRAEAARVTVGRRSFPVDARHCGADGRSHQEGTEAMTFATNLIVRPDLLLRQSLLQPILPPNAGSPATHPNARCNPFSISFSVNCP
jgi:hypothetical protein